MIENAPLGIIAMNEFIVITSALFVATALLDIAEIEHYHSDDVRDIVSIASRP